MATNDKSGFTKVKDPDGSSDNDDDAEWIDRPEEGESVQGIVLEVSPDTGKYGSTLLKLKRTDNSESDKCLMWSNSTLDRMLDSADASVGDEIMIEGTDSYQFEGDDGQTRTGTEHQLYIK